jgi:hypothetical protein
MNGCVDTYAPAPLPQAGEGSLMHTPSFPRASPPKIAAGTSLAGIQCRFSVQSHSDLGQERQTPVRLRRPPSPIKIVSGTSSFQKGASVHRSFACKFLWKR